MKSNNSSLSELENQSSSVVSLKKLLETLRVSNSFPKDSELEEEGNQEINTLEEQANLKRRKYLQDLTLQKIWFWTLTALLITVTISMLTFIVCLGLGYFNYEKYSYFPQFVLGTFFGYFYSLSKIVTKYLYSK